MTKTKKKSKTKRATLRAGTPEAIRKLVAKFDGNISAAARAIGKSTGYLSYKNSRDGKYSEADLAAAQDVLDGKEITPASTATFDPTAHTFKLGICIVVSKTAQFERLYDIGEAMGGQWLMKMSIGTNWLGILKIVPKDKLQTFAKIAAYDAERIAAP